MANTNFALICLLARTSPTATPHAVAVTARDIGRLAHQHLLLCERQCNEPDPDGATARELDVVERKIGNAANVLNCTARFETDPRGITVWIAGIDGTTVDA